MDPNITISNVSDTSIAPARVSVRVDNIADRQAIAQALLNSGYVVQVREGIRERLYGSAFWIITFSVPEPTQAAKSAPGHIEPWSQSEQNSILLASQAPPEFPK